MTGRKTNPVADAENPYGFPQYVIDRVMQKRGKLAVYDHFEAKQTALLIIDMQNFYVGEIASVVGILPNINKIAARMREVDGVECPAGATVKAEPGGLHVMLIGLTAPLTLGSAFTVSLQFHAAGVLTLKVPVT